MVNKTYHTNRHSTRTRPDIPISKKFLRRAQELKAQGKPYDHWTRAARIIWKIERGLPVGHHARKFSRKQGRATV